MAAVLAVAAAGQARAGWIGTPAADAAATAAPAYLEQGQASYYGPGWNGRRTASGGVFNMNALTAAHHWLPFGTKVRVRLEATGEEVVVMITDRLGTPRRVIDLSLGAARALGMLRSGVAQVTISSAE